MSFFFKHGYVRWLAIVIAVAVFVALLFLGNGCPVDRETKTVRGQSLSGLVKDGSRVTFLHGYYACHEPARGDLVLYDYAGNDYPLLKQIRAIPGDSLSLQAEGNKTQIMINGEPLKTSSGEVFIFGEATAKLLALYVRDFQGVIPQESYLILGNLPHGSVDSSQFGLVAKKDLLGKVRL
jgi:signal peptidase I